MENRRNKHLNQEIQTQWLEGRTTVEEYLNRCVDVPTFLECCKACENYGKVWSCPPYSFSPEDYWKKYSDFQIVGIKIFLPQEVLSKTYTEERRQELFEMILLPEKEKLNQRLLKMEKEYPGSISLSGGSCQRCEKENCTRRENKSCRFPEKMRYSIESLGGNVGLTVTKYLYEDLLWVEEGKLPEYFILVGGLLIP